MSQEYAVAEARRLQAIMTRRGVRCTVELMAGRPWSGDPWYSPKHALMNHHTAGSPNGLTPSYALCRNGRAATSTAAALPGPLCNGYGGRDHVYRIITLGLGNHPGPGGPLTVAGFTIPKDSARISCWGTEWEHNGTSPWPADMREFMGRANAALLEWRAIPLGRSHEHSTWAMPTGRKIDRNTYTAARGQAEIAPFLMSGEDDDMSAKAEQQIDWLFQEFSRQYPNPMGHKGGDGKVLTDSPASTWLWTRLEAWRGKDIGEQILARIGAMEGLLAALLAAHEKGQSLTPEQIADASEKGALAALEKRISEARVEISPKETA